MKSAEDTFRASNLLCQNFGASPCTPGCACHTWIDTIRAAQIDAAEWMRRRASLIARDAWMVPPDGGSPSKDVIDVCDRAEAGIYAIKLPGDGE